MKSWKTWTLVAASLAALLLVGCRGGGGTDTEPQYQLATAQPGDLTVEITSSGNLLYSNEADLAFDVAGTVGEVLVEVGDLVEEGQVLARLDAEERQDYLDSLEQKVEAAERGVDSAQKGVTSAERSLTAAERKLATSQSSLFQAEINVKIAELALKTADEQPSYRRDEDDVAIKELQVELSEMRLEEAQDNLLDAEQSVEDAHQAVTDAEEAVVDAQEELATAEFELREAQKTSITIEAPFDGLVTTVGISPYDAVKKGKTVIVVSDSTKFEATMLVNEIDILKIRLGAVAIVEVDALPGTSFPARVTGIAPTASAQQGVVNYRVTAELQSLEPQVIAPDEAPEATQADEAALDEVLDKAVADGRLTQEQADILRERLDQAGGRITAEQLEQIIDRFGQFLGRFSPEQLDQFRQRLGQGQFGQRLQQGLAGGQLAGGIDLSEVQLRAGLSVTVRIITQQRNNALLVPNQAISLDEQGAYVEMLVDGVVEPRRVLTGVNDWQFTEILQGLSAGEEVIIGRTASSDETSQSQQPRGGFRMFPGQGRFGR